MLADIGHPFARGEPVYDVTFENVQAGLRTDYLFRLANQRRAFVMGTGDLSELALGWCTYGVGDQMSHYNVNGSVAKTLIQYLIRWVAKTRQFDAAATQAMLLDPRHRDLARAGSGQGRQHPDHRADSRPLRTAGFQSVLRHALRLAAIQDRVPGLARVERRPRGSWPPEFPDPARHAYDLATIRKWLEVFLFRFFAISQFKRSALPNGPKVVSGGNLSPRGDWRAPSDGNAHVWLDELRRTVPENDAEISNKAASSTARRPA